MWSGLDLSKKYIPRNIEKLYCQKLNTHVRICKMVKCSLYEQCEPKLAKIQNGHVAEQDTRIGFSV